MTSYTQFSEATAEKLFSIIDSHGSLMQWKKKWNVEGTLDLPRSQHGFYHGSNLLNLWFMQDKHGWKSNKWMTFLQINQEGGHVLKGAKSEQVTFWKQIEVEQTEDKKIIPIFKTYKVFNLDQTSLAGKSNVELHHTVDDLINVLDVPISEFGNRAFYNPSENCIVMPCREQFARIEDFQATLLHELIHWTGHENRLNRVCVKEYSINKQARAEEELVAEIGAVFLSSFIGVTGDVINHASYIASWKKDLNMKAVTRAITQASQAFHWLISKLDKEWAAA